MAGTRNSYGSAQQAGRRPSGAAMVVLTVASVVLLHPGEPASFASAQVVEVGVVSGEPDLNEARGAGFPVTAMACRAGGGQVVVRPDGKKECVGGRHNGSEVY